MSSTVAELRAAPASGPSALVASLRRGAFAVRHQARRPGLMTRFTIIGATMALLVATTLAGLIEARLSAYVMDLTVARAVDQVELGVLDHVTPAGFQPPFTP